MRKISTAAALLILMSAVLFASTVQADDWFESEPGYYTLLDENGSELTVMAREISVDDEYVSGDNKHYVVTRVDRKNKKAYARYQGQITLPVMVPDLYMTAVQRMTVPYCCIVHTIRNPMFQQTAPRASKGTAGSLMWQKPWRKI